MQTAVAYVPVWVDDLDHWTGVCGEHCTRLGYHLDSVTRQPAEVQRMLDLGQVDVVVVGTREHAEPDWTPRIEAVDEATPPPVDEERPRRLW